MRTLPNLKKFAWILPVFALIMAGCQREIDSPVDPGNPNNGINDNIMVTGGLRGTVIDENGQPVEGATVTSGGNNTTTDRYGFFRFNNIQLSKANGYVKVVKPGYFTGTRTFISTAGRIHQVRIQLLPKTTAGSFSAAAGGTVSITGGAKMVMPASAITDAGGIAYTGVVNVAMTWINPTATNLPDIIPGDLRGITTGGQERGLETYGMLGVELTGAGGQSLKIAAGKTAELSFPIPAALAGTAPATIDLWHFDEVTGRWKQEGQAVKTGSFYVGQVSHFSFWNCDAPFPLVNLCMTVVNAATSLPLNNVQVRIVRSNNSYGSGITDSAGNLCGKVPKDEPLVLQIMDPCNNPAYSQNIGPFSGDVNLGTIAVTIPAPNSLVISGTVTNCSGGNVTNGAALIYSPGMYTFTVPVTAGNFSFTLLRCGSTGISNFTIIGVDYATMQQGPPVTVSGTIGTLNVGTIQACGTSSTQFVEFLVDGIPYGYSNPPDNINAFDSLPTPPWSSKITVNAFRSSGGGTTTYSSFTFNNNGVVATGLPLTFCYVSAGAVSSSQIITPSPTLNITAIGPPVTGFIEGNFSIQMDFSGTPRNVVCNFRVRRP